MPRSRTHLRRHLDKQSVVFFVLKIPFKLPIIRRTVIFNGLSMASAIVRQKPQMENHLYHVQHQVYLIRNLSLSCSTMYYIGIIF